MLEARHAVPATALAPVVSAEPPKPFERAVEDAIAARAIDPAVERLTRQYAQQMAARKIPADVIAKTIQRGALPRETVDEELRQVVS